MLLAVMAAGKPIDNAVLDQNGLSGEAVSTVTYVAGPTIPLVMGAALLAVAHMVSLSASLRGECTALPIPMRRKTRAFAVALGILSVAVISIGLVPILLAIFNPCSFGFIPSIPSLFAMLGVVSSVFLGVATVAGLAVLPFCLLHFVDCAVPAPTTPEDGDSVRQLESLTSAAFTVSVALTALDVLTTLAIFGQSFAVFPVIVSQVLPVAIMLCVLAALKSMLRRLDAGQDVVPLSNHWTAPLAFSAICVAIVSVLFVKGHPFTLTAATLGMAQIVFAAALLRLVPAKPLRIPAPAHGPETAFVRRATQVTLVLIALLAVRSLWNAATRPRSFSNFKPVVYEEPEQDELEPSEGQVADMRGVSLEMRLCHTDNDRLKKELLGKGPLTDEALATATQLPGYRPIRMKGKDEIVRFVSDKVELSQDDVDSAQSRRSLWQTDKYEVEVELTPEGRKKLLELTKANCAFGTNNPTDHGRMLAILVNGELISAPVIEAPITNGRFVIYGNFTDDEAIDLAVSLSVHFVTQ
ncbi:MAG: hypothetical protein IJQ73_14850 [Kiritimatiellae bacterium]|nr:hypothetical protein [Kiritimatiellia bacterium]